MSDDDVYAARLRRALQEEARTMEPQHDALGSIRTRAGSPSPSHRSRWVWPLVAAAAVAAVVAAIVFVPNLGDDQTGAGPASSNSSSPTASESSPAVSPSASASASSTTSSQAGPAHSNDVYNTGEFADGQPFIVVNTPLPGSRVKSPVRLSGTAVVFEATVSWEVFKAGSAVEHGFTTASIGAPNRGDWTAEVTLAPGTYELHVWETSMKDGSRQHEVTAPFKVS
jgi:hypothetical protein